MAKRLLGKEVNEALVAALQARTAALKEKGITATLGIIRLGENPSDLSYEKGATKRAELVGVEVKKILLPADATTVYRFANLSKRDLSFTYSELIIKRKTGTNARITSLPGNQPALKQYTNENRVAPARIDKS